MDYFSLNSVNLLYLNEIYKKELENIFSTAAKPTLIIWDEQTKFIVYSIYTIDQLEKSRINDILIKDVDNNKPLKKYQSIIFFIKSTIKMIDMTQNVINMNWAAEYLLVFVPHQLSCHIDYICKNKLDKKFSSINQFKCFGMPLESDIISIECPEFIMDMNELNPLYQLAKSIMVLQSLYGIIPNISGKGEKVEEFIKILKIMQSSSPNMSTVKQPKIHQMLIFDRRVDMITPLLSQITYESLLDEVFKLKLGFLEIPTSWISKTKNMDEVSLFQMNASDSFYAEVRNLVLYDALKKIFNFHKDVETEREKYLKANKLEEMAEVTNNLKAFKSREKMAQLHLTMGMSLNKYAKITDHTNLIIYQNDILGQGDIDKIHPFVEECLLKKLDIEKIIPLICLQSLCSNGLKLKMLNWYKKEIIRTYGIEYLSVLFRLESMGLLTAQQSSGMLPLGETAFNTVVRTLNLIPESKNIQLDVSNLYAGFVPIITRLVQYHSKPGWASLSKVLSILPGREFHPKVSSTSFSDSCSIDCQSNNYVECPDDRKVVLVVYIGGVTYSEISTLRFLSQQEDSNTSYIIATTGILNLPKYLEALAQPFETRHPTNPFLIN